jgi:hypothetical protein
MMEQLLGRKLLPDESVHHKDGEKLNNDPSNLELWVKNQPTGIRARDALNWAFEVIARYADEPIVWDAGG